MVADVLSSLVFFVFRSVWPYRKAIIVENLRNAFPENSESEYTSLVEGYYRHLSRLLTSPLILHTMREANLNRMVRYDQIGKLNAVCSEGRDAVLMASHFGNWEYLLSLPLYTSYQVVAVCAKIKNAAIQEKMTKLRSRYGAKLVHKEDFYRYVLSNKSAAPTLYVLIADQRPSGVSKQCVDFFGRKTMVQTGADRIARHLKCPVLYADVFVGERNHYTFRFEHITHNAAAETTEMVVARYYELLEKTIRRKPELWLWSHRRWRNPLG